MLTDILGSIILPHVIALFLLFRVAVWEIRPAKGNTFQEDTRSLWAWIHPHWRLMVAHPLYWAAAGIVTALFLVEPIRRLFL